MTFDLDTPHGSEVDDRLDDPSDEATAPPVVAVVVAHDPGAWFDETLEALAAQDYLALSVLVIDADSGDDLVARVAPVLPSAFVRRLDSNPGYGTAANEALVAVEGAAFLALCHDDVVLDPSAIRLLVEEAFRSNAGIVGPKVVAWAEPESLLQVGLSADKTGVVAPMNERGELDQEQHDGVRDVFAVPGACTLVRADLFEAIGGFDPAITFLGEDLDLSWRAHIAGARVVVAPNARARHVEALATRRPIDDRRRLQARHRLRSVLTCYGPWHLLRVLPQAAVLTVVEAAYALVAGHVTQARDVIGAWAWNLRRLPSLRRRRRLVRATRVLPDAEVRRLQVRGSSRMGGFVRGELGGADRVRASFSEAGRSVTGWREGSSGFALVGATVVALVLLVGSRGLLGGDLATLSGLAPFGPSSGAGDLVGRWASGWHTAGIGSPAPVPTAFALLGAAGFALFANMGLLQVLLVLGSLPIGAIGAWRLARDLGSTRAKAVGMVAYVAVGLPYDDLARGRVGGLVLYAGLPFVLRRLLTVVGRHDGGVGRHDTGVGGRPPAPMSSLLVTVFGLGLLLAVLAAFVPGVVLLVPLVAAAFAVGASLVGGPARFVRLVGVAVAAAAAAFVLHLPWALDFVAPDPWSALGGVTPSSAPALSAAEVLRFATGPVGQSPLGYALLAAALLPLLIARGERLVLAAGAWGIALVCWALTWLAGRGSVGVDLPGPEVLLAPAAVALAFSAALGTVAFERDLSGFRFGWRQVAGVLGTVAVAVAALPVALGALDGRWDQPEADFTQSLAFMEAEEVGRAGAFRVLWLGGADVLPLASYPLGSGLAYGLSDDGPPDIRSRWAEPPDEGDRLVARVLRLAGEGATERLGGLLAPFGVRYVVVADRAAPERSGTPRAPVPDGVTRTLAQQLDLRDLDVDDALAVYENAAWVPGRIALPTDAGDAVAAAAGPEAAVRIDMTAGRPVLGSDAGALEGRGDLGAGAVYLAEAAADGWELEVDSSAVERTEAFGWANRFEVPRAGTAELRYRTPIGHSLAVGAQVALWLATSVLLIRARARRRRAEAP